MSNSPLISNCTADAIRDAALALKAGHLVAFPTETVYGLGADARNPEAIRRIYEVKGRPTDHPLIVHISSLNQLDKWAIDIPEYAIKLARKFWPGPMTLILKRSEIAGDFITGGQNTVGLRVPSDPIAIALITEFEKISNSAIAAPSANRFGRVSPTSSADVQEELGNYLDSEDRILDGGISTIGIESTIIDCTRSIPSILRSGFVTHEDLELFLCIEDNHSLSSTVTKYSGSFDKHYSPACKIKLDEAPEAGEGFFALSHFETPPNVIRLASPSNAKEFAKCLYSSLRLADNLGLSEVSVYQPPDIELGRAIRDRLRKASNAS
jgi:L-threonylcarbamoyladenylate synthase